MPSSFLRYDDTRMNLATKSGMPNAAQMRAAHKRLEALRAAGTHGFFDLPSDTTSARVIQQVAKRVRTHFRRLIVVGIGGSDLGARTLCQALGKPDFELVFLGNPDPMALEPYLTLEKNWKHTALCVVSKSGTTLETMSMFFALRKALVDAVGTRAHTAHVFVITDPNKNPLHELADAEGYALLAHPLNVGGRFSVLSTVGLFPAACAGIDIQKLLRGAKSIEDARRKETIRSLPAQFAAQHYAAYTKQGRHIHILMPYASHLTELAFWYRQLWAESLGKRRADGTRVGPTPVAAFGSADQHSQIQLYNEGPVDKVLTFLKVNRFTTQARVPPIAKASAFGYLSHLSFEKIMHASLEGTSQALAESGCPNGTLSIPSITPESIGAILMFYELATAYMAELLDINAYNQPGVEAGKKIAKGLLKTR